MRRERSLRRRTRYSSASLPFDVPATAACNRPDGRGPGAAIDVRRNAVADVADRLLACAANTRMRRLGQMQQTTPEVRPDAGRATHFTTSARSTGGFERLPGTRPAICRCSRRPKGRSSPRNDLESGECRLTLLGCDSVIVVGTHLGLRTRHRGRRLQPKLSGDPRGGGLFRSERGQPRCQHVRHARQVCRRRLNGRNLLLFRSATGRLSKGMGKPRH